MFQDELFLANATAMIYWYRRLQHLLSARHMINYVATVDTHSFPIVISDSTSLQ